MQDVEDKKDDDDDDDNDTLKLEISLSVMAVIGLVILAPYVIFNLTRRMRTQQIQTTRLFQTTVRRPGAGWSHTGGQAGSAASGDNSSVDGSVDGSERGSTNGSDNGSITSETHIATIS